MTIKHGAYEKPSHAKGKPEGFAESTLKVLRVAELVNDTLRAIAMRDATGADDLLRRTLVAVAEARELLPMTPVSLLPKQNH